MQINEYEEKFWSSTSFYYSLEGYDIWDVGKHWDLEHFLIKLSKCLKDKDIVNKGYNKEDIDKFISAVTERNKELGVKW